MHLIIHYFINLHIYVSFCEHTKYVDLGIAVCAVNKQINDKERISAAMENPNLRELVDRCVADENG